MPSLTTTVTTTTDVELSPKVKRQLLTELNAYQALKVEVDALYDAMEEHKTTIRELRETTGEKTISLNGFTCTNVAGTQKKLNKKKLLLLGCSMAWLNEATEEKPKKAYELVTCPGEKKWEPKEEQK